MNQIDLIILGIIGLFVLLGYRKGLVKSVLSLLQYILTIFFSFQLTKPVAQWLINGIRLDEMILDWFYSRTEMADSQIYLLNDEMIQMFMGRIINVIAFILVFIVLKIGFRFLIAILNQICQLPILNQVNKLGGICFGGVQGILIVYIFITLLNWLPMESLALTKNMLANSLIGNRINSFVPAVAEEIINNVNIKDVAKVG